MIAEAMEKVGKEGVITVEEAKASRTELDVVEGMQFDRGYLALLHHQRRQDDRRARGPYILLHEKKISLHPRPAAGARAGRAVRQAAADHRRGRRGRGAGHAGGQQAARRPQGRAVKAPGFGDRRKAMLEDIAILTGGR
jgi:chaperonin GroEL